MTSPGRESCWAAKVGAIGRLMDALKQERDKASTAAEYQSLDNELQRLDGEWDYAACESILAERIMCRIYDLTGKNAQCVVAYDFSNWDLFGQETPSAGVREAPLFVKVEECPVTDDGTKKRLQGTGHITICAPLPPGWSEAVHYDDDLSDQLGNITCLQRMADSGRGNYHMFSSSEDTTGLWGGAFTWRVFYAENYDGSPSASASSD
jgi:hypothetical protein